MIHTYIHPRTDLLKFFTTYCGKRHTAPARFVFGGETVGAKHETESLDVNKNVGETASLSASPDTRTLANETQARDSGVRSLWAFSPNQMPHVHPKGSSNYRTAFARD